VTRKVRIVLLENPANGVWVAMETVLQPKRLVKVLVTANSEKFVTMELVSNHRAVCIAVQETKRFVQKVGPVTIQAVKRDCVALIRSVRRYAIALLGRSASMDGVQQVNNPHLAVKILNVNPGPSV